MVDSSGAGITVRLFHRFEQVAAAEGTEAGRNFFEYLIRAREQARSFNPPGAKPASSEFSAAEKRFWAIRKLESGFIVETFAALEKATPDPLRVLDVGPACSPPARWIASRGHRVVCARHDTSQTPLPADPWEPGYGSRVWTTRTRTEMLPFAAESFDVVMCLGLLHELPAGNDIVAIWELARVLKPAGALLLTFDVSPVREPLEGEPSWPQDRRRFGEPFSPITTRLLLQDLGRLFHCDGHALPVELEGLSWQEVHNFWTASGAHDARDDAARKSLSIGCAVQRRLALPVAAVGDVVPLFLRAELALEDRLSFYRDQCEVRSEIIDGLEGAHPQPTGIGSADLPAPPSTPQYRDVAWRKRLIGQAQLLDRLAARIEELENVYRGALRSMEALADARQTVIVEQSRALEQYRAWRLLSRAREWLKPRLGVLYHYTPRHIEIPAHYATTSGPARPPKISVVTPSLNQGPYIEETIRSVLEQGYPNVEYIVQDGASQDETRRILERYQDRLAHWASEKDTGQSNAINRGFKHATGEILAYLNSDDILLPGALNYVAAYFEQHPEIDVVYGHRVLIDERSMEIGRWVLPQHDEEVLSWADWIPQETLFWRRSIWDKVGGAIDESFRFAMDWDLIVRFRDAGARFVRLGRFLGAFRVHPHQKTSAAIHELGVKEMNRLRERCLGKRVTDSEIARATAGYLRRSVVFHKLYRAGILRY